MNLNNLYDKSSQIKNEKNNKANTAERVGSAFEEVATVFNSLGNVVDYDVWVGNQATYDALGTYDSSTIYFIVN